MRSIVFAALVLPCALTCVGPHAFAHDDNILDPHNATPGVRLELLELPRTKTRSAAAYRMRVTGVPRKMEFELWTQDFGALFRKVASGFRADEKGNVVSVRSDKGRLGPVPLTVRPGPFPKGAAWSVALVSTGRDVRTFAAVIPRPMISRSGACIVQLELISYNGDRFVATGAGFAPGEEVTVESKLPGRTLEKRQRIAADGRLPTDVIVQDALPANARARYAVTAPSCQVAIDYDWGKHALVRR
jgi:hypothetical protein